MDKIEEIQHRAMTEVAACRDLPRLDELRVEYLGKKGEITAQLKALGKLEPEQRKAFGAAVNRVRDAVTTAIAERRQLLETAALEAGLQRQKVDVTLPGRGEERGGLHPVTRAMQRAVDIFSRLGFDVATGPEVEQDYYNFAALNFPEHHPARAMHDTFYFGDGRLLRTHTSPVQIRVMEQQDPPYRIIAPGKVYRSDSDQTHTPMFHQIEGLLVGEGISMADLKGVLRTFVNAFFERALRDAIPPFLFSVHRAFGRSRHRLGQERRIGTGLAGNTRLRHGAPECPQRVWRRYGTLYRICLWHGHRAHCDVALRRDRSAPVFRERSAVSQTIPLIK